MNKITFEYCVKCDEKIVLQKRCTLFVLKREKDIYDQFLVQGRDPNEEEKGKQIIANVGSQIEKLALANLYENHDKYTIDMIEQNKNPLCDKYKLLIRFQ